MLDEGFGEEEIRAVMGENVKRFLLKQLPARQANAREIPHPDAQTAPDYAARNSHRAIQ